MKNKYKVVAGSLVGAVVIHAVLIACGGGGGSDRGGGHDAGPLAERSDDGGMSIMDAMLDALSRWMDGTTPDARADTDGGACGCTVQGSIQSVPASESATQLLAGNVTIPGTSGPPSVAAIATGPFVLTDATSGDVNVPTPEVVLVMQPAAAACVAPSSAYPTTDPGFIGSVGTSTTTAATNFHEIHGGHYLVPSGKMLCGVNAGTARNNLAWAGFRPY